MFFFYKNNFSKPITYLSQHLNRVTGISKGQLIVAASIERVEFEIDNYPKCVRAGDGRARSDKLSLAA